MSGGRQRRLAAGWVAGWVAGWAGRLRRDAASPSARGAEPARCSGAARRRVVVVTTFDAGGCRCDVWGCGRGAELLISVRPAPLGPGRWASCVDHWGVLRSVFIGRGDRINYGPGAPELIIKR